MPVDVDRYLTRIGLPLADVDRPSLAAAERVQRAHVTTVPFGTLSITGDPVVSMATDEGHVKLRVDSLTEIVDGDESEESVAKEDWHDVLERRFGIRYGLGE